MRRAFAIRVSVAAPFLLTVVAAASVNSIELVSATASGAVGNATCDQPVVSGDGRFVAFESLATNLLATATSSRQIFVRDRQTQTTEVVSRSTAGTIGNNLSFQPDISPDGRFVVFQSLATNLAAGGANGKAHLYLRDRTLGTTERITVSSAGGDPDDSSFSPSVSDDGRFVAFASSATNLVAGETATQSGVYVRDRQTGTTERVSRALAGAPDGFSMEPSLSGDGRFVAFTSQASNLVAKDRNGLRDVFVYDRATQHTELVSVGPKNKQGNGESSRSRISPDGRFVAFQSTASTFGLKLTNFQVGDFVRDRALGRTEPVSVNTAGQLPFGSSYSPTMSADGRLVAFQGQGLSLAEPQSGQPGAYVRDRQERTTERASATASGAGLDDRANEPAISRDGGTVVFISLSTQLAANDANLATDVFASSMTFPPAAAVPLARAGSDLALPPTGKTTKVRLDATASTDPHGSPLKYVWTDFGRRIASGPKPTVKLTVGAHAITLIATDRQHLVGTDEVIVTVTQ